MIVCGRLSVGENTVMRNATLFILALGVFLTSTPLASAAPYTFTPQDFIDYGIYFSPRGSLQFPHRKLLTIRFGNIEGWYAEYIPGFKNIPKPTQQLRLSTPRGSVRVNRNDNVGLTVTRDTYRSKGRGGTKLLDVSFERGRCRDASGVLSQCAVTLRLTTDGPDRGVVRQSRTLRITTSTGLKFRYRSVAVDGGKPLNRPLLDRTPVIINFATEWRAGEG